MNAKKALEKAMKRHDEVEPWLQMVFSDVRETLESTPLRVWWGHVQRACVASAPDADLLVLTVVVPFRKLDENERKEANALNDDIVLIVAPPSTAIRQAVNEAIELLERRLLEHCKSKAKRRENDHTPPHIS